MKAAGYMLYRVKTNGPGSSRHLGQRAQRDHLPVQVADLQPLDVLDLVPKLVVALDDHLPGAAEEVEIIDIDRAQVDLQRSKTSLISTSLVMAALRFKST